MKNALLRYDAKNGTFKNMGDYVQSIAAKQFVGDDAVLLEREHLNNYMGEPVKLIMAAWWMHFPENWPPSSSIIPLFISFHITPEKAEKMLTEKGIAYLKKHEPIGCRDKGTQRLLETKGIKAYFSGCLTLTLGKTYQYVPEGKKVAFVDPYFDVPGFKHPTSLVKSIFVLLINFNHIKKINKKLFCLSSFKKLLKTAAFYRQYSKIFSKNLLVDADYYSHSAYEPSFKNEKAKFDYTDGLLRNYSKAVFMVTSRLHASLPAIAMGVPTIFVQNEKIPRSPGRFEGLLEHVNLIEYKRGKWHGINGFELPKLITIDSEIKNKNTHFKLAQEMSDACEKFIEA